jgi:hypothetical protein
MNNITSKQTKMQVLPQDRGMVSHDHAQIKKEA